MLNLKAFRIVCSTRLCETFKHHFHYFNYVFEVKAIATVTSIEHVPRVRGMKVPRKGLTPFRLSNFSYQQASHIGAVLMPMYIYFASCSQTLSSPSRSSGLGRRAAFPITAAWVSGWVQPVSGPGDQSIEGKRSETISPWSLRQLQPPFKKAAHARYNQQHLPRSGSPSTQDLRQPEISTAESHQPSRDRRPIGGGIPESQSVKEDPVVA